MKHSSGKATHGNQQLTTSGYGGIRRRGMDGVLMPDLWVRGGPKGRYLDFGESGNWLVGQDPAMNSLGRCPLVNDHS